MFVFNRGRLLRWSFYSYLIPTLLPIVSYNLNLYNLFFFFSFILLLIDVLIISKIHIKILALLVFITILIRLLYIGQWHLTNSFGTILLLGFEFWYPLIWVSYIALQKDIIASISFKKISRCFLILYVITCTSTIIGNMRYSIPSRWLATSIIGGELKSLYRLENIAGFGFSYLILFIVPLLIYLLQKTGQKKYLVILFLSYFCAIETQYTSLLLLLVPATILGQYMSAKTTSKLIMGVFSFSIVSLIFANIQLVFNFLLKAFADYPSILIRVNELYNLFATSSDLGNDIGERQRLYTLSIDSFKNSVLFGTRNPNVIGGHSQVLDLLAASGLFGATITTTIIFLIYSSIKPLSFLMDKTEKHVLQLILFLYVVLAFINPIFSSIQLGLVIPIVFILVLANKENNKYEIR
ncbi:TPA: hypothetical protein U1D11_001366 [Streptococcus suis]|nr:hypothetical protein [Streptococcus suis]